MGQKGRMNVLTELAVKSINTPGRHSVGDSLYLNVSAGNSKRWSWLYKFEGKRREAGLGSYPLVSLKEARKKKDALKVEVANGNDLFAEREVEKTERNRLRSMTFEQAAYDLHALKPRNRLGVPVG